MHYRTSKPSAFYVSVLTCERSEVKKSLKVGYEQKYGTEQVQKMIIEINTLPKTEALADKKIVDI